MARRQCEGIGCEGCVMWSLLTYLLVCLLHEHWHVIYSAAPFLKRMWDLRQTAELQEESWKFLLLGREESPGSRSSRSPSCAWNNCIIPSKHVKTLKQGSSRLAISMAHRRCWPILSRQRRLPDYYSKYPFVDKLPSTEYTTINCCLKSLFAEQGVPVIIRSGNGPQFSINGFRKWADEYWFRHVTSSPHYPRSNRFIKSQVKFVKKSLTKAQKSGLDPALALLSRRTMPIDEKSKSPAELLYGRQL